MRRNCDGNKSRDERYHLAKEASKGVTPWQECARAREEDSQGSRQERGEGSRDLERPRGTKTHRRPRTGQPRALPIHVGTLQQPVWANNFTIGRDDCVAIQSVLWIVLTASCLSHGTAGLVLQSSSFSLHRKGGTVHVFFSGDFAVYYEDCVAPVSPDRNVNGR